MPQVDHTLNAVKIFAKVITFNLQVLPAGGGPCSIIFVKSDCVFVGLYFTRFWRNR